ncbi:MAG TPA: hypothetical protein VKH43_00490 [Thermoanaerobaculia bacterium]|nr:hypothetical protein [Thermoanaerobaculia bacterium]
MSETEKLARFSALLSPLSDLGPPSMEYSESASFGDYLVKATWPDLELRLVQDKGVETIDVRPPRLADEWFDLPLVIEFLGDGDAADSRTLDQQVAWMAAHLPDLRSAFQSSRWPSTKRELERSQKRRAELRFGLK